MELLFQDKYHDYLLSSLSYFIKLQTNDVFLPLITPLFGNKKVIFPIPTDRVGSVLLIRKLSEEGKFKAVIDRKYSLEEIAEAYRYVEKGQKTGNVIITL